MNLLVYILANLMLIGAAICFTVGLKLRQRTDFVLAVAVIAVMQIVVTELFLGLVHRLFAGELLLVNALLLLAGVTVIMYRAKRVQQALCLPALHLQAAWQLVRGNKLTAVLLVFSLAAILWLITLGLLFPPHDYDGLAYHLTAVAAWLQAGQIYIFPTSMIYSNVYPMNTELVYLWNMIFLKDTVIVELTQLGFALLGVIAVAGLARCLGISRANALNAGLIFLLTPVVLTQAKAAYVDLAFAVMFLVGLYFVLRYRQTGQWQLLLLAGVAGGILLGMKSSGAAYAGILYCYLVLTELLALRQQGRRLRRLGQLSLLFGLPVLALGSFWYLRTWIAYGNPLYPFTISLFGWEIFAGRGGMHELIMVPNTPPAYLQQSDIRNVLTTWLDSVTAYNYDPRTGGFGPWWFVLGLPAIIYFLLDACRERQGRRLWFAGIIIVLFLIQPAHWWTRYTIVVLALGAVAIAACLDRFTRPTRMLTQGVLVLVLAFTCVTTLNQEYFTSQWIVKALRLPTGQQQVAQLGIAYGADLRWLDRLPAAGAKIAYTKGVSFIFPLYGDRLQNEVIYVEAMDGQDLVRRLQQQKARYLVTRLNSDYDFWAREQPKALRAISQGDVFNVYQIIAEG